ncbi:MAG: PTS transporter subunit EIIB [Brevinema sp.]
MNSQNTNFCSIGKILFIYLGGAVNIRSISNCISRLRLEVAEQELTAPDKMILSLKNRGIIRFGNNIHIIFNHKAPFLQKKLRKLHKVFKDKISQNIIFLTQNQISKFEQDGNLVTVHASKEIKTEAKFILALETLGCKVDKKGMNFSIIVPEDYSIESLGYACHYWELVQSYAILDVIDVHNIKKVASQKSIYRIVLKEFVDLDSAIWHHYGLPDVYCNEKDCEIQFTHHSKELMALLQAHIDMETMKI